MRELARGLFLESKYPGVRLGAVVSSDEVLLVDSPIRTEDGREWLSAVAAHGRPRYLVVLDHHPDRVLGARGIDLPIVSHDWTRTVMLGWPDTFKGGASPIGAEADRLKRVTGVRRAIPDLTFSDEMHIRLGEREIVFRHRPGPTEGAIWVEVSRPAVVFLGDAVTVAEPPYLGEADIDQWLVSLESLRCPGLRDCALISSRDGKLDSAAVNAMMRFLRKIPDRLERLAAKGKPPEAAAALAGGLLEGFRVPQARREQALLRLQAGLARLYTRKYPPER
jgi:glyoxylase-like metal-dependent hydrolase (beta-lactamase superfamily II)